MPSALGTLADVLVDVVVFVQKEAPTLLLKLCFFCCCCVRLILCCWLLLTKPSRPWTQNNVILHLIKRLAFFYFSDLFMFCVCVFVLAGCSNNDIIRVREYGIPSRLFHFLRIDESAAHTLQQWTKWTPKRSRAHTNTHTRRPASVGFDNAYLNVFQIPHGFCFQKNIKKLLRAPWTSNNNNGQINEIKKK